MTEAEIFELLDEKADIYNHIDFIESDPIQIPHRFTLRQDIEIAGLLSATIAWGNRKSIIKSAEKMMQIMGNNPYDFVMNVTERDLDKIENKAIHRTFNGEDFKFFIQSLQRIYTENESLENLFLLHNGEENFYHALERFRNAFLAEGNGRTHKHISSSYKNSSCKRLMMYLRWMVRRDNRGVDFGIWDNINQKYLSVPLDVHTGNISRQLGLISRRQNDWKTIEELDIIIRKYNSEDPARYDFALFGLGITGELK